MMIKVNFYGITENGCGMYTSIIMDEDYTMNQLVKALKTRGFIQFRTETMNVLVNI